MSWRSGDMLLQALGLHGPSEFVVALCIFLVVFILAWNLGPWRINRKKANR